MTEITTEYTLPVETLQAAGMGLMQARMILLATRSNMLTEIRETGFFEFTDAGGCPFAFILRATPGRGCLNFLVLWGDGYDSKTTLEITLSEECAVALTPISSVWAENP